MRRIKTYQRVSFALSVALMAGVILFTAVLLNQFHQEQLRVLYESTVVELERLADDVDEAYGEDPDYDLYFLPLNVARLDAEPGRYAEVFDGTKPVSERTPTYSEGFDPWAYQAFIDSFKLVDGEAPVSGSCVVSFTPDGEPARDVYLCWRRMPTASERPWTVVSGVSLYSVPIDIEPRTLAALAALLVVVCIVSGARTLLEYLIIAAQMETYNRQRREVSEASRGH